MSVRCITIKNGNGTYYIPLDKIKMLVTNPDIQKVPLAEEHIAGISCYNGEIVTYYRFGDTNTDAETEEEKVPCGILLKKDPYYRGICATGVLEEAEVSEDELENQLVDILAEMKSGTEMESYD